MTTKAKSVEFADELLRLFEDRNKIIYDKLIRLRHQIRNRCDDYDAIATEFLSSVSSKIAKRDHTFFVNTPYETIAEWIWTELTPANRVTIWKWISVISSERR